MKLSPDRRSRHQQTARDTLAALRCPCAPVTGGILHFWVKWLAAKVRHGEPVTLSPGMARAIACELARLLVRRERAA